MKELTSIPEIVRVLETSRTVAVVGFHRSPTKPAHYVPEYLSRQGYRVIPVNPILAERGDVYLGQKAVASLSEIQEPVDVVEVFRRPDRLHEHLDDILSMPHKPATVWLQLGIVNPEFARSLVEAGIQVVQNRCMLTDHRQFC